MKCEKDKTKDNKVNDTNINQHRERAGSINSRRGGIGLAGKMAKTRKIKHIGYRGKKSSSIGYNHFSKDRTVYSIN